MSKDNTINEVLSKINAVEGFNPADLAVDYIDMNSGESNKRLPVKAQIAWFRLKYPEGKIALSVKPAGTYFVAEAKIYRSYQDPPEFFLAEATAARGPLQDKPTVSPREWAQTAAVGVALRNAGFGLQFQAAGDSFETPAVDELGALIDPAGKTSPVTLTKPVNKPLAATESSVQTETEQLAVANVTQSEQDPLEKAMGMMCPASKYSDKTLRDMITLKPDILPWIIKKYGEDSEIGAAAKLICEHALKAAG